MVKLFPHSLEVVLGEVQLRALIGGERMEELIDVFGPTLEVEGLQSI